MPQRTSHTMSSHARSAPKGLDHGIASELGVPFGGPRVLMSGSLLNHVQTDTRSPQSGRGGVLRSLVHLDPGEPSSPCRPLPLIPEGIREPSAFGIATAIGARIDEQRLLQPCRSAVHVGCDPRCQPVAIL